MRNHHPDRPVVPVMTDAERARGVEIAKADRQAVFKGDCASCHVKNIEGKYGKTLYDAVCAICHEAQTPRHHGAGSAQSESADQRGILAHLDRHGKPGSLMPAFATSQGGPLNDMQIASLAAYLNTSFRRRFRRRSARVRARCRPSECPLAEISSARLCCQP